jgi:hypothetical protein
MVSPRSTNDPRARRGAEPPAQRCGAADRALARARRLGRCWSRAARACSPSHPPEARVSSPAARCTSGTRTCPGTRLRAGEARARGRGCARRRARARRRRRRTRRPLSPYHGRSSLVNRARAILLGIWSSRARAVRRAEQTLQWVLSDAWASSEDRKDGERRRRAARRWMSVRLPCAGCPFSIDMDAADDGIPRHIPTRSTAHRLLSLLAQCSRG